MPIASKRYDTDFQYGGGVKQTMKLIPQIQVLIAEKKMG